MSLPTEEELRGLDDLEEVLKGIDTTTTTTTPTKSATTKPVAASSPGSALESQFKKISIQEGEHVEYETLCIALDTATSPIVTFFIEKDLPLMPKNEEKSKEELGYLDHTFVLLLKVDNQTLEKTPTVAPILFNHKNSKTDSPKATECVASLQRCNLVFSDAKLPATQRIRLDKHLVVVTLSSGSEECYESYKLSMKSSALTDYKSHDLRLHITHTYQKKELICKVTGCKPIVSNTRKKQADKVDEFDLDSFVVTTKPSKLVTTAVPLDIQFFFKKSPETYNPFIGKKIYFTIEGVDMKCPILHGFQVFEKEVCKYGLNEVVKTESLYKVSATSYVKFQKELKQDATVKLVEDYKRKEALRLTKVTSKLIKTAASSPSTPVKETASPAKATASVKQEVKSSPVTEKHAVPYSSSETDLLDESEQEYLNTHIDFADAEKFLSTKEHLSSKKKQCTKVCITNETKLPEVSTCKLVLKAGPIDLKAKVKTEKKISATKLEIEYELDLTPLDCRGEMSFQFVLRIGKGKNKHKSSTKQHKF